MKPSIIIAVIFLLLVSIAHLLRLIFQVKVRAGAVRDTNVDDCPGVHRYRRTGNLAVAGK